MPLPQALESRIQALKETLTSERACGEVFFSVAALGDNETDVAALDARARELGFNILGERWRPLSRAEAEALLGRMLHLDLAYDSECMEPERARELAARFCDLFGPEGRFFSNAEATAHSGSGWGWNPLTGATFDIGVGACGAGLVGLVGVMDED
ncbi:hypothetical protein [Archangium sp.]|uniref:hypothetical protein n=1 Tax=Archangium sp. TaxID=1872627 RepID=UPI002D5E1A63|nr:hypothetical protein [Archangium sp.]HYO54164.1 hypothetical protein [Archangium sp.]